MNVWIEDKIIINELKIADTFISRFRGLMFYKVMPYEALMVTPCNSIHMFFMKFDIDVVFLDKNNRVIHKIEGLKKRQLVLPIKKAKAVIESSKGHLSHINVGDCLTIC